MRSDHRRDHSRATLIITRAGLLCATLTLILADRGFADDGAPRGAEVNVLRLVTDACPDAKASSIAVELRMDNLQQPVTGFQAFVEFDPDVLAFDGTASCYTKCEAPFDAPCGAGPFQLHFPSNIAGAGTFTGSQPGQLNVIGSTNFFGDCAAPTQADAVLAILVFQILAENDCVSTSVRFRNYGQLDPHLSFQGDTVETTLIDTGLVTFFSQPAELKSAPQNIERCEGGEAVFEIAVTGCEPFEYQWSKDELPLTDGDGVSGAQTSQLTISALTLEDAGEYACVVNSTCGGTVNSSATLIVWASGSGDVNLDGFVDGLDVRQFVEHLISGEPASESYCAADMDIDGLVTMEDIEQFVERLLMD